jgi:hypothetical protein
VDQAVGELAPGVYVMVAESTGPKSDDYESLATQWFIVSDLGLTAFSGNDGIHVFVNSLASTEAVAKAEVRLVARNNEILATRKTDDAGHVLFEAGLARGEGGLSPAMLTVSGGTCIRACAAVRLQLVSFHRVHAQRPARDEHLRGTVARPDHPFERDRRIPSGPSSSRRGRRRRYRPATADVARYAGDGPQFLQLQHPFFRVAGA